MPTKKNSIFSSSANFLNCLYYNPENLNIFDNCTSGKIWNMTKVVLLNEELGSQMQIYLALCEDFSVEIAESLEATMYLLRKLRPEVLLCDYHLECFTTNGKSGIDFIRRIKRKYSQLKVVTILTEEDRPYESEIQRDGADGVIYKPIRNRLLIANIKKLVTSGQQAALIPNASSTGNMVKANLA
jgi:DNA-binding NarL/FixJ family response regulator